MVSIDLYRTWPSIRRKSPAARKVDVERPLGLPKYRTRRSTTLDLVPGDESRRKADVGADSPARFLQILVESISGKPLSSFFPVAEGLPRIVGVDGLSTPAAFQSFLEAFHQAMQFLTLPNQPVVRQEDDTRRRLRASVLGVRDAGAVRKATPRVARKFDEFLAQMPASPATLAAALEAGSGDGIPLGFAESLSAFVGAMRAAIMANDVTALHTLGSDFGSLLVALHQIINGGEAAERGTRRNPLRRTARTHTAGLDGPVLVRKSPRTSRALIKMIQVGDEDVDVEDAVFDPITKKWVKRRRRKG